MRELRLQHASAAVLLRPVDLWAAIRASRRNAASLACLRGTHCATAWVDPFQSEGLRKLAGRMSDAKNVCSDLAPADCKSGGAFASSCRLNR
jgi:hypothetical protein